jgi:hypothetical protein
VWTNYADVTDRWVGGSVPADEATITTLISDAEDTILREFPDIEDRIDAGTLPVSRVVKVAARMVIRHLRNPTGQRSTSQGAGPFQQSITYGGDEPGAMYLTDADRYELAGPSSQSGKAASLDMTPSSYSYVVDPDEFLWTRIR